MNCLRCENCKIVKQARDTALQALARHQIGAADYIADCWNEVLANHPCTGENDELPTDKPS